MLAPQRLQPCRPEMLIMSSRCPLLAPTTRARLGLLLVVLPLLLGADDNYLREIEEEAKRQAAMLITRPSQAAPATTAQPDAKADRLESGLAPAAFEQALRRSLPGTYTLYQQLNAKQKQEIYKAYQDDSQLTNISARVAQQAGGQP